MKPAVPLASFWLLYMGGMGLVFPFQSLYFKDNAGLSGVELGLVIAIRPFMGMIFQPIWGQVADRTGRRAQVLGVLSLGAAVGLVLIAVASSLVPMLVAVALTALFATSVMSVGSAVSMAALAPDTSSFGRVRSFGTLGFGVLVLGFPFLLDQYQQLRGLTAEPGGPQEPGLEIIFLLNAAFAAMAALAAFRVPSNASLEVRAEPGGLRELLRHGPFVRFVVFCFLAYFFLHAPIQLLPIFVQERGGDLTLLSRLWIPMLLLEVPLVFFSSSILRRLGGRGLLALGVGADGLRWILAVYAPSIQWLFVIQLLHGVVVAGLIIGSALYVDAVVPERLRSTGQTVVGMVGVSLASALSGFSQGMIYDGFGIEAAYLFGGTGALLLVATIPWLLPKASRPSEV